MKLDDYLNNHTITRIGHSIAGYVCCEIIVDNPIDLIPIVRENNCYISEIRWWDRVKIASGSIIGYGGPRDPRNPNSYFFAETDICKTFDNFSCDKDYYVYLQQIFKEYNKFDLHPAFDIKRR